MVTYQIQVNERTSLGKALVAYLRSIPQIVTLKKTKATAEPLPTLYECLDSAFADVKLMVDGKKRKKTAQEFLEEIRRENEL